MRPAETGKAAQRRAVSERLRRFFAALTAQLAAGTAEIWAKVERQMMSHPRESALDDVTTLPPPVRLPIQQQQPVQQQQQKAKPSDDGKKATSSDDAK